METSVQKLDTHRAVQRAISGRAAARGLLLGAILVTASLALAQATGAGQQRPGDLLPPLVVIQVDPEEEQEAAAPDVVPDGSAPPSAADQVGPPLALTQIDEGRDRASGLDGRERFSLRFAEPMPITELLLLLFRGTPFSIVPDPDVEGSFMGELKEVTLTEALDLVLRPLDLDYSVQNGSIRVFRRRLDTRLYPVDHVATRRSSHRGVREFGSDNATFGGASAARGGSMPLEGIDDVFEELAAGVRTLLSEQGRFNLDRKAALLQVTDFPDRLDRVTSYLDAVETRVNRQVLIEAEVIEIELLEAFVHGLDWDALRAATADPSFPVNRQNGLLVGVPRSDSRALRAALATQGRVNVLSKLRVVTTNNEPAVMQVGTQDVFFVTTAEVERNGRTRQSVAVPQTVTEGLTLSVTPQISLEGVINMSVAPRVSERTGETTSPTGDVVPVMSVREANTVVRVYEGETVVVAGLMQDRVTNTRSKVPVVGSIPLLGRMFRRNEKVESKTDLIILLTPRIVPPGRVSAGMLRP